MRLILLLVFLPLCIAATPQIPHRIVVDGDTTFLLSYLPVEQVDTSVLNPARRTLGWSTACWDGVYHRWFVRNDSLFFDGYLACDGPEGWFLSAGEVLGRANGPVFADWITTDVFAAEGELITRYDVFLIFEREKKLSVASGIVRKRELVSNERTKIVDSKLTARHMYELLPWGTFPDTNRMAVVGFEIDSLGYPQSLTFPRSNGPLYDSLSAEVVRHLPSFTVYYLHGKYFPTRWNLPISFSRQRYEKWLEKK